MTGKDTNDMTASELLLKAAEKTGPDCFLCHEVFSIRCNDTCGRWCSLLADKIDAELAETRADGISEGVDVSLRQGAELWAKDNGWPDFRDGEDFGAWLDRCTYKKPVDDCNEPVQFGDEIELHRRSGGMNKGCLQEVYVNKGPVMILSFVGAYTAQEFRYDTECDVLKRPAHEALGADGKPVVSGETVWLEKDGCEGTVKGLGVNGALTASVEWKDGRWSPGVLCDRLTHTPPDTQERIDRDKHKAAMHYWECADNECFSCPCKIDGKKPSEYYGVFNCTVAQGMDIARRQAELASGRGGSND